MIQKHRVQVYLSSILKPYEAGLWTWLVHDDKWWPGSLFTLCPVQHTLKTLSLTEPKVLMTLKLWSWKNLPIYYWLSYHANRVILFQSRLWCHHITEALHLQIATWMGPLSARIKQLNQFSPLQIRLKSHLMAVYKHLPRENLLGTRVLFNLTGKCRVRTSSWKLSQDKFSGGRQANIHRVKLLGGQPQTW